jgi:hypothetical protein
VRNGRTEKMPVQAIPKRKAGEIRQAVFPHDQNGHEWSDAGHRMSQGKMGQQQGLA